MAAAAAAAAAAVVVPFHGRGGEGRSIHDEGSSKTNSDQGKGGTEIQWRIVTEWSLTVLVR